VITEEQASLVFAAHGRIAEVRVKMGDQVRAGEVLAELESGSVSRQIERAQAAVATAQAFLAQVSRSAGAAEQAAAEAALQAAQAGVDASQAQLNRLLAGPTALDVRAAQLGIDLAKNQLWGAQAQRDAVAGNDHSSGANKDGAEAQVLVAEVGVQQAELAEQRANEPAHAQDVAALQAQVRQAQAQVGQAQAQIDQLAALPRPEDVAVAKAQLAEAQVALAQAQDLADDLRLLAPYDGVVTAVHVHRGEWATIGQPAVSLADVHQRTVRVQLDELDVAQMEEGQRAIVRFEALPGHEVEGVVGTIAPAATQTQGGVAYLVDVDLEPTDLPVRLGMTTNVDVVTQEVDDALLVPNRAISADREAGRYFVSRLAGGLATTVEVEIGLRNDAYTQVVSGLQSGDVLGLAGMPSSTSGSSGANGLMGRINSAASESE